MGVVVVDRDGWIVVFGSADEAIMKIEGPDVEAGEYLIFDSAGRVIEPYVGNLETKLPWWRRIRSQPAIGLRATEIWRPALLVEILSEVLQVESVVPDCLDRLVSEALARPPFSMRAPDAALSPCAFQVRRRVGLGE